VTKPTKKEGTLYIKIIAKSKSRCHSI